MLVKHHISKKINIDVFLLCRTAKKEFEKMVNVRQSRRTQIGVMIYSILLHPPPIHILFLLLSIVFFTYRQYRTVIQHCFLALKAL